MRYMIVGLVILILSSTVTQAGTCTLTVAGEEPAVQVRVCEVDGDATCSEVLYEGPILSGEARFVSPSGDRLTYQILDSETGSFDPITTAICDGGLVEL